MQAAPQPGIYNFLSQLICSIEVPNGTEISRGTGRVKSVEINLYLIRAEELRQYFGYRSRDRTVRARVLRLIRRIEQRAPTRLLDGSIVSIVEPWQVSAPVAHDRSSIDSGDRTPEQEGVFLA